MKIKLQELREERGVSQNEVAEILKVTRQAYSRYERGERELGYAALYKLAEYFDVSIDYLLGKSSYFYSERIKLNYDELNLSPNEERLLKNFRAMRSDLQTYYVEMSETFILSPETIAGEVQKKKN